MQSIIQAFYLNYTDRIIKFQKKNYTKIPKSSLAIFTPSCKLGKDPTKIPTDTGNSDKELVPVQ